MSVRTPREYSFKIVICGDWAVGKTSLVRRYSTDAFSQDYLPTIGANVVVKEVDLHGFRIHLTIWDTGGQERFSSLRRKYYEGADGVIFAFDLTRPETFHHIESRWLPEVNAVLEDYTPALLATKADLAEKRVVSPSWGEKLGRRLGASYFEISALTGQNVEKAFRNLSQTILSRALTKTK